jgi:uncharacterized protein YbaA (DUF1428 family)
MKIPGTYIDGFLLAVPTAKLDEYRQIAERASAIWLEQGALQYTECAGDDMKAEGCTSFISTADAKEDETVIFAWAVFADREARDAANAKISADERLQSLCPATGPLFDYKRMSFGGFKTIVSH